MGESSTLLYHYLAKADIHQIYDYSETRGKTLKFKVLFL